MRLVPCLVLDARLVRAHVNVGYEYVGDGEVYGLYRERVDRRRDGGVRNYAQCGEINYLQSRGMLESVVAGKVVTAYVGADKECLSGGIYLRAALQYGHGAGEIPDGIRPDIIKHPFPVRYIVKQRIALCVEEAVAVIKPQFYALEVAVAHTAGIEVAAGRRCFNGSGLLDG